EAEPEYEVSELIRMLEAEMLDAAQAMEFERAATLRDQVRLLKERYGAPGAPVLSGNNPAPGGAGSSTAAASKPSRKIRRSELEEALSNEKPRQRPGTPGVRANRRKKGRFD